MYTISTLAALCRHLGLDSADSTGALRLQAALEAASAAVERRSARRYLPQRATILHSLELCDVSELLLRDDLLELTGIVNGDGTPIALEDVLQLPGGVLRLTHDAAFVYADTPDEAIAVTGLWGYHPHPERAWALSVDQAQGALDVATAQLAVSDATRFEIGHVLRLDDELCIVLAQDDALHALTVMRGALGTNPVNHDAGTAIAMYQPPADVVALVLRWAAWLYREPDAPLDDLPPVLLDALTGLQRISVRR